MTQTTTTLPPGVSTRRYVFRLALPAVGEQVLNTIVGLTDVFLLGNLTLAAQQQLGYDEVTAVAGAGLANQMIWLVTVLFMAAGVGTTAAIARASGAGDQHSVQRFLRQSMLVGLGAGLLATLIMGLLGGPFLTLLGAQEQVWPRGLEYLMVIAPTLVPTALLFVCIAALRGVGDTRTPLYVMLGANAVNVLLTWLLVSGNLGFPALGVVGAAVGTAVARGGGGLVMVGLLLRGRSGLKLDWNLRPERERLGRLLNVGLPTAGEMFIFHAALLVFTPLVTGIDTTGVAYAAHNATITIESLSFLPGFGYAFAASTLVGQALGARAPDRAREQAFEALWQGMAMMVSAGLLMVVFPATLLGWMVNDPAVVAAGTAPLRAAGLAQAALAVGFILNGALRGAGDTRWPMKARLFTTWCVRIPLALLLVGWLDAGLNGIWLAMCADFTLQGLLALWRFSSGRWQQAQV